MMILSQRQYILFNQVIFYFINFSIPMERLESFLSLFKASLHENMQASESAFNNFAANIDFAAFCVFYSIVLLWFLRKVSQRKIFRPKNKELVDWKVKAKKAISTFVVQLPIVKQIVKKKFTQGLDKVEQDLLKDFQKDRDPIKSKKLQQDGLTEELLANRIKQWFSFQQKKMFSGKLSGAVYIQNIDHSNLVNDFAAKYMYHNPLHLDTYKQVSKMQAEVLSMTNSLISKNKAYGIVTSGGSESLIMSIYAYKTFYSNKKQPNIVVPNTIHAAVDKGAMYFNVEVRKAKLNNNFEVDLDHMKSLIDGNTICLYGSYPNYPHGIVDPVVQIAKLAKQKGVGFHIDGCLGGFVAAFLEEHEKTFTLDLDGATSISLDQHKFGLAPKGVSTLFFKTPELRHSMYFVQTNWIGGIYATPSCPGSRSGFASAGAWYSMTHVGKQQYIANAKRVQQTTINVAQQLSKINGIKVIGKPELCVVTFTTEQIDPFSLSSYLGKTKNWKISPTHIPRALHMSITLSNCSRMNEDFARDIREALQILKLEPIKQTSTAALYGASATLPSEAMGDEMLRKIMSITYK